MIAASVCSGIGGAELAFQDMAEHAFMSETEPFPRAVLRRHFPHIPLHGDFREIQHDGPVDVLVGGTPCQSFSVAGLRRGMEDERGNLALEYLRLVDRLRPRWVLWENVPGVLSSAGGRDFGAFVGGLAELGYGVAWRCLDAQHFGLAQRRQRVFVVGCLGDWRRAVAVLFEPASLRGHPAPGREAGERTAATLTHGVDSSGKGGYAGRRREDDTNLVASTLRPPSHDAAWRGDGCDNLIAFDARQSDVIQYGDMAGPLDTDGHSVALAYGGGNTSGAIDVATAVTAVTAHGGPQMRCDFDSETFVTTLAIRGRGESHDLEWREDGTANAVLTPNGGRGGIGVGAVAVTHSLRADGFDASEDGTGRGTPLVAMPLLEIGKGSSSRGEGPNGAGFGDDGDPMFTLQAGAQHGVATHSLVRRLTPLECERLQGFPDGWTDIQWRGKRAADGPRYRALGNAFAVPVVRWIAKRLAMEHMG